MTLDNKFLLKLDLQAHADGDDDNTPPTSGDDDLAAAIRSLLDSENNEDDDDTLDDDSDDESDDDNDDSDDDDNMDDDTDDEDDSDDEDDDQDNEDEEDEEPKGKQSKEKNAEFARKRRETEARQRAEAELERLKNESPEFKLAQMLSEQFGKPVEDIMEDIREQQLQAEAKSSKVPVEVLRKQREAEERADRLEQDMAMLKFQQWETQIKADGDRLMSGEYKGILTQEDIDSATDYILNIAQNVNLPLEDAVFAVHGKKIVQAMAKGKVQDELATASGRKKKTPLPPNNGKANKSGATLSADEKLIAKAFNMSDEDYIKYKS